VGVTQGSTAFLVGVGDGVGIGPHTPCKIVTVEYWYVNEPLHAQNVGFEVLPGRVEC